MSARARGVIAALGVGLAVAAVVVVALREPERPRTLQERVDAIGSTLRCPVCADLSVADSPSQMARQMRGRIAGELRAGRSPEQIEAGFVRSYGEWILLAPERSGLNLVAWVAPVVLLLVGAGLVLVLVRRWTSRTVGPPPADDLAEEDRLLLERELTRMGDVR